ncbi:diheme cytochrome c [Thiosulfatihalobacter marinus]|uniref:diheme cytochrome c n=1 Tax=Thiosulfatihalobacter marinus TaxID=2792481 RepID=UPI0018D93203|nr:diheme cytochrome c [Thiosulfatihalobacter marinus]
MKHTLSLTALALTALPAFADESEYMPPVSDPVALAECSECHMAYPAGFLPQRSWSRIMATLEDHFGEDASLDADTSARIETYLTGNAADAGGRSSGLLYGVAATDTPLRISDMPWFRAEHDGEVSAHRLRKAGSISNCAACHRGAERGSFED